MNFVYFSIFVLAWVGALLWSPFAIMLGAFEAAWKGVGELA